MQVTTLHDVEAALRTVDPETLQEMVHQMAHSHATLCKLTSSAGDCGHIPPDETRDRVDSLEVAQLAALLAPSAWISIDLHSRIGG